MTAFVILAAGPGSRMGAAGAVLHKALLPLGGRAVLSHQIGLAPPGSRIIVCVGYRAQQIMDYCDLAHPGERITFVGVPGWARRGGGPGASLLAARDAVAADDLVAVSCDTLWEPDPSLWQASPTSWAAVAPLPSHDQRARWCRLDAPGGRVRDVWDKLVYPVGGYAYTGLCRILAADLPAFWEGVALEPLTPAGERRDIGGLRELAKHRRLTVRHAAWTDTGDEAAYARARGYDWSKNGETTWVLPDTGRVVKHNTDPGLLARRVARQASLAGAVPPLAEARHTMAAWKYAPGVTAYEACDQGDPAAVIPRLLDWAAGALWRPVQVSKRAQAAACARFYRDKTYDRAGMLDAPLTRVAVSVLDRVRWPDLTAGCQPVTFHGDFNLGNIIATPGGGFTAIDWRDSFAGEAVWGDRRYDLAKLTAGLFVHWARVRAGDFRPWRGDAHLAALASWLGGEIPRDILTLAGLSLLNSAPLHTPPLDAVLVEWAADLLESL